jgi:simple sugar transport system ATP-binding protein
VAAVLEARHITKQYGHVEALREADFDIEPGEVVSLIGDNGAGKSTLVRILSGSEVPDSGEVLFSGEPVSLTSPSVARGLGMETVFQDLALAPHLDPIRNLFLGREIMKSGLLGRLGFMDNAAMKSEGIAGLKSLGAAVRNFSGPVAAMSGGQKQSIAVARAALWAKKVIFLDEPTAALGVVQTKNVLDLIKRVRDTGIAVVFISHSMPHVMQVSDRIKVMRRGVTVATYTPRTTDMEQLVGAMTGALEKGVQS